MSPPSAVGPPRMRVLTLIVVLWSTCFIARHQAQGTVSTPTGQGNIAETTAVESTQGSDRNRNEFTSAYLTITVVGAVCLLIALVSAGIACCRRKDSTTKNTGDRMAIYVGAIDVEQDGFHHNIPAASSQRAPPVEQSSVTSGGDSKLTISSSAWTQGGVDIESTPPQSDLGPPEPCGSETDHTVTPVEFMPATRKKSTAGN
jgi:hypothetical protein